jgi:uncharacterized protein YbjQ (UPF0145 family)
MKPAALAFAAVLLALPAAEAQRPAIDVRVIEGDLGVPYTVVGQISAEAHVKSLFPKKSGRELVDEQLREKAAKMGADAVVQVKYDTYNPLTSKKGFRAAGQAVKFMSAAAATTPAPIPAPAPPPPVTVSAPVAVPVAPPVQVAAAAPSVAVPVAPPVVAAAAAPAVAQVAATGVLLSEQNLSRAYDVIGPVNVELNQASISLDKTGRQVLDETLRKTAADLGADAVILIRYAGAAGAKGPTAIGVAVKYK